MDLGGDASQRARFRLHVPPGVARERRLRFLCACPLAHPEGARTFFERWQIGDEPGEVAIVLEGDVGLVPLGGDEGLA